MINIDETHLHKIQAALGGRLIFAISGAAPLNKTIAEFFHACGVTILEGLGMTENTSFSHVNRLEHNKFGTVGQPGPGCEVKLAEDGEVLFRGANVMQGYFKDPDSTAETFDSNGWLLSGDIGEKNNIAAGHPDIVAKIEAYINRDRVEPREQIEPDKPEGKRFR